MARLAVPRDADAEGAGRKGLCQQEGSMRPRIVAAFARVRAFAIRFAAAYAVGQAILIGVGIWSGVLEQSNVLTVVGIVVVLFTILSVAVFFLFLFSSGGSERELGSE